MNNLPFNISAHVMMFIISFFLTLAMGPVFIPFLTKLKFGQTVRDDGPQSHLKKTGTPTMGGFIFLVPLLIMSIFYARYDVRILPIALVTIGFGLVGFLDDFIKVVKKRKDGLYWNQKMLGLLIVAVIFSFYVSNTEIGSDIIIPLFGMEKTIDLAWFFVPFTILVLIASTNAVNITDGLDGLCAGVTLVVTLFFTVVAMTRCEWEYIKIFCSILSGGCLAFLAYNAHPAKVFMGDMGSLALGGAIGAVSIVMKMPFILFVAGGIYVIEALSVMIQVASFKLTRKRVFKMAPIHHHFELSGWREVKVVYVFWAVTFILSIAGLLLLGIKFY